MGQSMPKHEGGQLHHLHAFKPREATKAFCYAVRAQLMREGRAYGQQMAA